MPAKGMYFALAGGGMIVLWAGLKGKSPASVLRSVIAGKPPGQAQTTALITPLDVSDGSAGGGSTASATIPAIPGNVAAYKAFAMTLMVKHGWGLGQQWTDFQWVVEHESNWDNHATNSSSGAYGIAQALGHGNANTRAANGENNYGDFGTSDATCKAANGGNGFAQLVWMTNYIAQVYGSPSNTRARYNQG